MRGYNIPEDEPTARESELMDEIERLKARIEEHNKAWDALLYWAKSAAAIGSGQKHLIKRIDQLRPGAEESRR